MHIRKEKKKPIAILITHLSGLALSNMNFNKPFRWLPIKPTTTNINKQFLYLMQ